MARPLIPPLAAVRVFEAAARHLNFTAAATELGMTQAAVSYQIKVLEDRVGAPLFLRQPRGVQLSRAGLNFAAKATDALDILSEAFAVAKGQTEETLAVSAAITFGTSLLAQRIGKFQIDNPSISVRIDVSQTLTDFDADGIDLAIRVGRGNWPDVRAQLLMPVTFTPMLSPTLAAGIGGIHKPADLLKLPVIELGDPWWRQWFREAGVEDVEFSGRQKLELGSQILEATAAVAGQGVGILTPALYRDELARGQLYQPFDLVCDDGTGYWLVYPENRKNLPKIRAFENWLKSEVADFKKASSITMYR